MRADLAGSRVGAALGPPPTVGGVGVAPGGEPFELIARVDPTMPCWSGGGREWPPSRERRAAAVVGIIHGDIAVLLNSDDWADPDWVDRQPGPTKTSGDRCGGAPLSAFERARPAGSRSNSTGCSGTRRRPPATEATQLGGRTGCSAPMPASFSALN